MRNNSILRIFVCFLTSLAAGCGTTIPVPQQKPMESGILTSPPTISRAKQVPSGPGITLAVILSENTIESIKFLEAKKISDRAGAGNPMLESSVRAALVEEDDPDFIIGWVANSLKSKFDHPIFYGKSTEAIARGPDFFAILDIYYSPISFRLDKDDLVDAKITIRFYDRHFAYIATAEGQDQGTFGHWSADMSDVVANYIKPAQIRTVALQRLDRSLSQVILASRSATVSDKSVYDACMHRVMKISDSKLKLQAMSACDAAQ